ncbi:MAG: hypothetical protein MJZ20_14025, partial [Bacteroidaceae bacterium]|nr:hypothetical protein [Bacteroidaceae bacterium]
SLRRKQNDIQSFRRGKKNFASLCYLCKDSEYICDVLRFTGEHSVENLFYTNMLHCGAEQQSCLSRLCVRYQKNRRLCVR